VIRLRRNTVERLPCDEALFFTVVKAAFNQRRKTLSNALKAGGVFPAGVPAHYAARRAEQLSVDDFIDLVKAASQGRSE
jgi:16S rRNA (adenine1518-N6/adenine1519-N6)-dimethyltransferase